LRRSRQAKRFPTEPEAKFAYPPLPWIGARFKFDVREIDGNKVLAKTLDNVFFQRATVFLGHPDEKNYTFEADVMSDGSRRTMSSVGVINQRYFIVLNGNAQEMEIISNQERINVKAPFQVDAEGLVPPENARGCRPERFGGCPCQGLEEGGGGAG
jgi:hypothetical protein